MAQVPSPLWVGIRNSAMTPNIKPRLEETSFTLPHRTQKLQKTKTPDPKKLAQGSPQPSQTMDSPATLPLVGGHPKFGNDPNIDPRLEETSFTLPHRTQKPKKNTALDPTKLAQGSPQPGQTMVIPGTLDLWVRTRNSALNPHTGRRVLETSFTLPQRTQKPRKTIATDPQKLVHGSPQPCKTMGSPGTLPLCVGIRNSAMTPNIEPRLEKTSFTIPHRTQNP